MIFWVLGVLFGLSLAGALAYFIAANTLLKSNDFGDDNIDLQHYAGYDPIAIDKPVQVSGFRGDYR